MSRLSARHQAVLGELVEWWEDLSRRRIGSQAVLVPVPPQWGRSAALEETAEIIEADEVPCVVVRVSGKSLPDGSGVQAQVLRDLLAGAGVRRRVAELLGVDRLGGTIQLGLGVGGLFVSPLAAPLALLLASLAVGAAGREWDASPAGQEGAVARAARAIAALSVSLPVVVMIDDADRIEPRLAVMLVESLIERHDGQVLVIAAAAADSVLVSGLASGAQYGLTAGRAHKAEADADMGYEARAELAAELCPALPAIAARRIGQRTRTFADVFAVAGSDRLAELAAGTAESAAVAAADDMIDALTLQAPPSEEAVALAWAGGILHAEQASQALAVLGGERPGADADTVRSRPIVRLADTAAPGLAVQVAALAD